MFYVGQKVERVRSLDSQAARSIAEGRKAGAVYPVAGVVYTIRAIWFGDFGKELLHLVEIDNSHLTTAGWLAEPGFASRNFRPVVERKTDISIFKAMLNPSNERVSA